MVGVMSRRYEQRKEFDEEGTGWKDDGSFRARSTTSTCRHVQCDNRFEKNQHRVSIHSFSFVTFCTHNAYHALSQQAIDKLEEMLDGGMTRSKFATNEYIGIYT
jgi:hypothetical protein